VPSSVELKLDKKYRIPVAGQVKDVAVEHIRAAAYVPKVEITAANVSSESAYEPNDIDLVTVQASFDIGALSDSFQECFAGKGLPEEWRDTGLARPVFAAVQLHRQRLGADGVWSDWEEVPRTKTDPYRADFRVIEDTNSLSGIGVTAYLLKLDEPRMQTSLLQPEPYRIASADQEWFPPAIHRKFLANQRDKQAQEKRETVAAGSAERTEDRDKARAERERRMRSAKTTTAVGVVVGHPGAMDETGVSPAGGARGTTKGTPARSRAVQAPTPAEQSNKIAKTMGDSAIYEEMDKILLAKKDTSSLREPIVFWAHDDTAEPGKRYRYRLRLGVFNPVAGTGQVRTDDAAYDSKVILWSEFSDVTEPVAIPKRLYFFPTNVQETSRSVDVQVYKYALGYWHSELFSVKRGEVIGKAANVATGEQDRDKDKEKNKGLTLPETIDYCTGAVLVDVVPVKDWAGDKNLQPRNYFDMLYSFDGTSIERVAAKLMYWPDETRARYNEIKAQEKRPKEAFRAWSSTGALGSRRVSPGAPTGGDERERYMEEMRKMQ
jgi:hypothetical protein